MGCSVDETSSRVKTMTESTAGDQHIELMAYESDVIARRIVVSHSKRHSMVVISEQTA